MLVLTRKVDEEIVIADNIRICVVGIQNGKVQCPSLQCPGFGVCTEPDWQEMIEMKTWLKKYYPE